jgi:restriction system protein
LLGVNQFGRYSVTDHGRKFLDEDHATVMELDRAEGLIELLDILSSKGQAQRSDVLPEWSAFLAKYSNFGTESTRKDTLYRRLNNLVERGLVARDSNKSAITPSGVEYLSSQSTRGLDPKRTVIKAIQRFNEDQRQLARRELSVMDSYRFEQLVGQLLEQMGYEDVEVTKQSGDRGVDVVATVQFGITTVKEFVQVKRTQGTIQRQILDQLRGALPYHSALRGTLITLGDFSQGCKEAALFHGAAPITLINGDKLIDLMVEHRVGFTAHESRLLEFDDRILSTLQVGAEVEAPGLPSA